MFESKAFVCPHPECRKTFRKPLMLTDYLKIPRETYYACPYCKSKIDIAVENSKIVYELSIQASTPKEKTSEPTDCPYYFGYLRNVRKYSSIPDKCLTCSNLTEC